jgi:hypothetical protein
MIRKKNILHPLVKKRLKIYENIKNEFKINKDFDVVFNAKINAKSLKRLKETTINYVSKCLELEYKKKFEHKKNFLFNYKNEIYGLSNITPNGVVRPKKETVNYYFKIQSSLKSILKENKLIKYINFIEFPEVRIVKPMHEKYPKHRPFATSKPHSDAWAGHPADGRANVFIDGDVKNTLVYYLPINPKPSILKKKLNYNQSDKNFDSVQKLTHMKNGLFYYFDMLCVHHTKNNNCKPRMSIDFGLSFKSKMTRFNEKKLSPRYKINFINKKDWTLKGYKKKFGNKLESFYDKIG